MDGEEPVERLELGTEDASPVAPPPANEHVFRAAPMTLVQMYIAADVARDVVDAVGRLAVVQFRDLNESPSAFHRQFVGEIRRLDDVLRHVREIEHSIHRTAPLLQDHIDEPLMNQAEVARVCESIAEEAAKLGALVTAHDRLAAKRDELLEERQVLRASDSFFGHRGARAKIAPAAVQRDELPLLQQYEDDHQDGEEDEETEFDIDDEDPLTPQLVDPGASATILAGTIAVTAGLSLERLCWRVTRGNLYFMRYSADHTAKAEREVFLVYTHGKNSAERIRRIAESMDARIVGVDANRRTERLQQLNDQLSELFQVLDSTAESLMLEQETIAGRLSSLKSVVVKERAIFETLNLFSSDQGRRGLIAEGWVPTDMLQTLKDTFTELSAVTGELMAVHTIQTTRVPPTHHTTNKVTEGFQAMVNVYGIARYGEVNPGLPTVVTFPFMFAVMFGDLGHGFILFLGAFVLVWNEARISRMRERDELFDMAFSGRYVLLLMGLFSMYTGIIYNDLFSKGMTVFSSGFSFDAGSGNAATRVGARTYPVGIDWAWHGADNNLRFTNSYKMKLSVLLGLAHMTYSLSFQLVNARYFDSWVDVWGNFVPGLLFMQSIFGYLAICIVYKWSVDWIASGREPPSLLDMIIKMFLSPGSVDPPLFKGQAAVQILLLIVSLVCVPWLLLFKPLYLRRKMRRSAQYMPMELSEHTFAIDEDEGAELEIHDSPPEHHMESFGDIMIHQVIHTIEFCLNCISHTASYLRLWALSLAHNQLSQVLWNMTLRNAFGPTGAKGIVMVFMLFAMWMVITVLVLVCMEGTSAMLHALRLHWVEAMSKHFQGEGHAFQPFSFTALALG